MPGLRIRDAARTDLPAIQAIYNASIPLRMSTADLVPQPMSAREKWWDDRDHAARPVLVAEDDRRVLAWGAYSDIKPRAGYRPSAEISIYVDPTLIGHGVGRVMLDALLVRAPSSGIDRILAMCYEHNEPSLRLFRSRGFEHWGTLPQATAVDGVRRSVVLLGKCL